MTYRFPPAKGILPPQVNPVEASSLKRVPSFLETLAPPYLDLEMNFEIPESELRFRASRSRGPGGQHVNKTSTRIEALWDVAGSETIPDNQRSRIMRKLATRIDSKGVLHVAASAQRSQLQNRRAAVARMNALVSAALKRRKPRKKTKPPKSAIEKRLREKKRRSQIKRKRGPVKEED